jgi:hypothetical protein
MTACATNTATDRTSCNDLVIRSHSWSWLRGAGHLNIHVYSGGHVYSDIPVASSTEPAPGVRPNHQVITGRAISCCISCTCCSFSTVCAASSSELQGARGYLSLWHMRNINAVVCISVLCCCHLCIRPASRSIMVVEVCACA